uniref:Uncharacterized protein n=1 Tax=Guillardia theta TaxID=55529 RepID=A0A7S4JZA7_GUITH|mmetsp:Transcript_19775/g.65846  ORF Transcript_19775/g.65846 Transcript_19775/m.65846 type:complete len:370 (+) Transcript_19775:151-1260(+)
MPLEGRGPIPMDILALKLDGPFSPGRMPNLNLRSARARMQAQTSGGGDQVSASHRRHLAEDEISTQHSRRLAEKKDKEELYMFQRLEPLITSRYLPRLDQDVKRLMTCQLGLPMRLLDAQAPEMQVWERARRCAIVNPPRRREAADDQRCLVESPPQQADSTPFKSRSESKQKKRHSEGSLEEKRVQEPAQVKPTRPSEEPQQHLGEAFATPRRSRRSLFAIRAENSLREVQEGSREKDGSRFARAWEKLEKDEEITLKLFLRFGARRDRVRYPRNIVEQEKIRSRVKQIQLEWKQEARKREMKELYKIDKQNRSQIIDTSTTNGSLVKSERSLLDSSDNKKRLQTTCDHIIHSLAANFPYALVTRLSL